MAENGTELEERGQEGEEHLQAAEPSAQELSEARALGWVPKEQWRGEGGAEWLDAKAFLERGKTLLPVLTGNNRRMKEELAQRDQRIAEIERQNRALAATVAAIEADNVEDQIADHVATKKELQARIAQLARDGDFDAMAAATAELAEMGEAPKKVEAKGPAQPGQIPQHVAQDLLGWFDRNPEYKVGTPKEMLARSISDQMRATGDTRVGSAFLDEVRLKTEEYISQNFGGGTPAHSRVGGGNGGQGRSAAPGGMSKTYSDLPPEAKAACDKFERRLVGADKKFKSREAWQKSYTQKYFAEEGGRA